MRCLAFPVQVVEQVQTYDYISLILSVTRNAYHHGYLVGVERESRGFGRVDQTSKNSPRSASQTTSRPVNLDATSHVPPVLTKTWFHTGAFFGGSRISKYFEHEFYAEADG